MALRGRNRRGDEIAWRWDRVQREVDTLAERLASRPPPGGIHVTVSRNRVEDIIDVLASMVAGVVHAPLDGRLPRGTLAARQRQLATHQPPAGTGVILWTGGTTVSGATAGRGVCLAAGGYLMNAAAKLDRVPQTRRDRRLVTLPVSHAYARTCDVGTWIWSGSCLSLGLGKTCASRFARDRPTHVNTVPSLAARWRSAIDRGRMPFPVHLRVLGVGGVALAADDFRWWRARGVAVVQGYGATETGPVICSATDRDGQPDLVGRPLTQWQIRHRDGVAMVRGPARMIGYLGGRPLSGEEFFVTGDLIEISPDRQWRIVGRRDERIKLSNGVAVDLASLARRYTSQFPASGPAIAFVRDAAPTIWAVDPPHHRGWSDHGVAGLGVVPVEKFSRPLDASCFTAKGTLRRPVVADHR